MAGTPRANRVASGLNAWVGWGEPQRGEEHRGAYYRWMDTYYQEGFLRLRRPSRPQTSRCPLRGHGFFSLDSRLRGNDGKRGAGSTATPLTRE